MIYFIIIITFILLLGFFFRLHLLFFPKNRLIILMYHSIQPESRNQMTVSLENLEKQFQYLSKNNYKTLFFKELYGKLNSKSIILTFDDGYKDNEIYLLPLLKKYNFKATIFIPTSKIGNDEDKMTFGELKGLDQNYIELALHSHNHNNYKELSLDKVSTDLHENIKTLEENEVCFSKILAYPYGKYPKKNNDFFDILKKARIQYAVRIGNRINFFPTKNPFELNRIDIKGSDNLRRFKLKLIFGKLKLF